MGGAVFPPCIVAWGQTMVGVMAVMGTSFKKGLMPAMPLPPRNATVRGPSLAVGHHWPMPLPGSQTHRLNLPQSLVASPLLSPGSCCAQDFACVLQVSLLRSPMEVCNQIPLSFKVKFPGGSQSLRWTPRLESLFWGLELLQQWFRTSLK